MTLHHDDTGQESQVTSPDANADGTADAAPTPRPFPLSPPSTSQELDDSAIQSLVSEHDDDEDFPSVEKMLLLTRPAYATPTKDKRVRMKTPDDKASNMDIDPVNIKRQSQSPSFTPKSAEPTNDRTYIEILSSASECEPPSTSDPLRPTPKRKRSDISSQSATAPIPSPSTPTPSHSKLPPSKRVKTSKAVSSFRKHPKHWQLDGNTLVQIGRVRFKLQRSHLSKHGEWFRHTFEQGDAAPELHDGGVLCLDRLDISVRDFATLLYALDDAITYIHTPPPFRTLSSVLRAAYTLSFTTFEEWAIKELEAMWSPRLADLSTDRIPHATESLALARLCGLTCVKKRAMYELVRSHGYAQNDDDDNDDDNDDDDDHSGEGDADDEGEIKRKRKRSSGRVRLANADKDALTRAREQLTCMWILTAGSVAKSFMQCPSVNLALQNDTPVPVPCTTTTPGLPLAHMRLVHESGLMEEYAFDAVCGLQALIDAPWAQAGFCKLCVEMRRKAWQGAREKAWLNLGIWFGLGDE